ncbi:hypothetical protein LCGC14_2212100 [marine sediment metagenome]|uniref:Uncharacterized protein n=1 Tax=marine sediment metagenome TaxID=412755 RepID=A0A0F9DDN9_9ZZZZ
MTKAEIPEPPEAVKNGNGSVEIWKAIFENRLLILSEVAGMKVEIRVLAALVLATAIGSKLL